MVRETAGTGAGAGAVAMVVVVTVCVVVYDDGEELCVCADANVAAQRRMKARDSFFTRVSRSGGD
jgi:hypothetical protein